MIQTIKKVFFDMLLLYRNFMHWNISKLLVFLWSLVLGLIFALPVLIILFGYGFFTGIGIGDIFYQLSYRALGDNFIVNILLYLFAFCFLIGYMYQYVLLIKLNDGYIKEKKIKYSKNSYFDMNLLKKYVGIFLFIILFSLLPVLIFLLSVFLFVFFIGVEESKALIQSVSVTGVNNFFSVTTFVFFLVTFIIFAYILYRTVFAFYFLCDDKKLSESAFGYIRKSCKATRSYKVLAKLVVVFLLVLPIFGGLRFVGGYLENETTHLNNYLLVKDITPEEEEYLKSTPNYAYYQSLVLKYSQVPSEQLESLGTKYDIYFLLFQVFCFLFVYGVLSMIGNSFYRYEFVKK